MTFQVRGVYFRCAQYAFPRFYHSRIRRTKSIAFPSSPSNSKEAPPPGTMSGIFAPSESINYNFVAGVYGFFSALFVLLLVLHFYTPAVEGFFVTLLPFPLCFVWSLVVRTKWLQQRKSVEAAVEESKKDK